MWGRSKSVVEKDMKPSFAAEGCTLPVRGDGGCRMRRGQHVLLITLLACPGGAEENLYGLRIDDVILPHPGLRDDADAQGDQEVQLGQFPVRDLRHDRGGAKADCGDCVEAAQEAPCALNVDGVLVRDWARADATTARVSKE